MLGATKLTSAAYTATGQAGDTLAAAQIFTYRTLDEHGSVDPQIVEDTGGAYIVRDLFEGVMNQDADGNHIPGYTTNEEKNIYTFTLRDDAKLSDGRPVTAVILYMRGAAW